MELLKAEIVYETEYKLGTEVLVLVEYNGQNLKTPASVLFKKENGEYIMEQTGWIERYNLDADLLSEMILTSLGKGQVSE